MFNISYGEILLILVISLLIFGPNQLPNIARNLGKAIALVRNFSINLREQFYEQSGLYQFESIRDEVKQSINDLKTQLKLNDPKNMNNLIDESQVLAQEYHFFYQPELDFEQQPELFDE